MEITPAVFQAVDDYNETIAECNRRIALSQSYGLLTGSDINYQTTISDDTVHIQVQLFEAVSKSGQLIRIANEEINVTIPRAKGRECYLIVHLDDYEDREINGIPFSMARFAFSFSSLDEIDHSCVAISKMLLENGRWQVQNQYIPPCFIVGAHPNFVRLIDDCRILVESVREKLSSKIEQSSSALLSMLCIDFLNLDASDHPKQFHRLLYLIVHAISILLPVSDKYPSPPTFTSFNNDDVLRCVMPFVDYLHAIDNALAIIEPDPVKPTKPRIEPHVEVWDGKI